MTRSDAGFSLIETVVATAVFALVLSALYQGLTIGWRGLNKARAEETAIALLQEKLASTGIETPLQPATASGSTPGGMTWETQISPYGAAQSLTPSTAPIYNAFWVTVTVHWREGRLQPEHALSAKTLRLKRTP